MKIRTYATPIMALFAATTISFATGGASDTKVSSKSEKASCCSMKSSNVKKASMDKCAVEAKSTKECSTEKAQSCSMSSAKKSSSCCSMKSKEVKSTATETKDEVGTVSNTEPSPK